MSASDFFQGFKNFDYNNPDFENMGSWPAGVKLIACLIVIGLLVAGGYWFLIKGNYATLEREARKEEGLRNDFQSKAFQVANLDAFKAQLEEMQDTFGALLEQLPNETEISGLLDDITFTGIQSGLDFNTVELAEETAKEFYIETPIQLQVLGEYHELGTFISGIAALPRIVTLHDFTIRRSNGQSGSQVNDEGELVSSPRSALQMDISARTYRYNPGEEE